MNAHSRARETPPLVVESHGGAGGTRCTYVLKCRFRVVSGLEVGEVGLDDLLGQEGEEPEVRGGPDIPGHEARVIETRR